MATQNTPNSRDSHEWIDENILSSDDESDILFNSKKSRYITESDLDLFCNFNNHTGLNIMHLNCRSIKKNFDSLKTLLSSFSRKLTAIAISETWLSPATEDIYQLNGYSFVSNSKDNRCGGGVGIYLDNNLTFKIRNDLSIMDNIIECIFVEIVQAKSNYLIGCVYRPPGTDIPLFNASLSIIMDKINMKRRPLLTFMTGDFNIDLLKSSTHTFTNDFLNIMNSYSFLPTIKSPTRITESLATLIDNIFINDLTRKCESAIIYSDVSDHLPVIIHFHQQAEKTNTVSEYCKRVYSNEQIFRFNLALCETDWNDICLNADNNMNASEL